MATFLPDRSALQLGHWATDILFLQFWNNHTFVTFVDLENTKNKSNLANHVSLPALEYLGRRAHLLKTNGALELVVDSFEGVPDPGEGPGEAERAPVTPRLGLTLPPFSPGDG